MSEITSYKNTDKGKNTCLSNEEFQPSEVWKNKPQVRKKTNHESQHERLFQEKKVKYVKQCLSAS